MPILLTRYQSLSLLKSMNDSTVHAIQLNTMGGPAAAACAGITWRSWENGRVYSVIFHMIIFMTVMVNSIGLIE